MPLSEYERRVLAEIETELDHVPQTRAGRWWRRIRGAAVVILVGGCAAIGCLALVASARPEVAVGAAGVIGVVAACCVVVSLSRSLRADLARTWHRSVGRARLRWR